MKAVRSTGVASEGVRVVDVDEPPGFGNEILQMSSGSVCGSDLMYIAVGSRAILGHELSGIREDGSPVIVEALFSCMECELCLSGRYNLCLTHHERALGVSIDGGMAEQFRAPAEHLVPVPEGLDVRDAAVVEPTAVAWHALNLGRTGPETRVVVVGAGAIGVLAAAGARRMGAEDVAIEARYPYQKEAAERLGARVGASGAYDVVIEAAGSASSLARCAELVAPGGSIVVPGVHLAPIELDWMTLFAKEARVIPSIAYCSHGGCKEIAESAQMLADDDEIVKTVITHRFPIEDAHEAFRVAGDRTERALRVVIDPS
jgi:2-desacetyl-2-hydroxyethyl bacteriochlorophyllide A dehydrogenase